MNELVQMLFKDEVLLSMQQKLDSLCEQLYYAKDKKEIKANIPLKGKEESAFGETFGDGKISFVECGCWLCDQHHHLFNGLMVKFHLYFYNNFNLLTDDFFLGLLIW